MTRPSAMSTFIQEAGSDGKLTGRQVLDDHGSSGVEDDISAVVEVVQVVATVEASVSEDVVQHQLLETTDASDTNWRPQRPAVPASLTSTIFFFLVTLFFSSLSGSGAARLTGGLRGKRGQINPRQRGVVAACDGGTSPPQEALCAAGGVWFLTCS